MDAVDDSRTIQANDLQFTCDLVGPEDAEAVLMLHGFPQTRHTWRAELPALAAAGFRACAPDQRGYSAGARPAGIESYRIESLVADALAIADALGAERFHLVGHDWGGQLAWMIAAHHPERVRTLTVLSRPHPAAFAQAMAKDEQQSGRSRHHRSFQRAEATDELLANDCARLRSIFDRQGVPERDAEVYLRTLGEHPALDAAIHWYRAASGSGLRAADAPAIEVPTLYLWGSTDATVGRPAALATEQFVKAPYRFVELPDVGHFITDQSPDALAPLLLEHLRPSER